MLSMEGLQLQRTISDISSELKKEGVGGKLPLPAISEVEAAACKCCGLSEECTAEYISRVRHKFMGNLICGLCAAAVNEDMEKKGLKRVDALKKHMNECALFNRIGRTYPVLYQAEAIKEILKKSSSRPRESTTTRHQRGRIGRTSSCIPTITKDVRDPTMIK